MNVRHMLYCSIVILLMTMLCIGSAFAAEDDAIGISMQEDGSAISSVAPTDFLPELPESIDSLDNAAVNPSLLEVNAGAEETAQIKVGGKFNLTTKARSELHISFADWKMDELGYVCEVENETVLNFVTSGHSYLNLIPRNVGDTNITITSNADSSINTTVHVVVEETVVSNITLPSNPEFSLGTTGRLSAILYDQFGNLINHDLVSSPEKVEWSIESGDALTLTQANGIDRSIWVNPVQIGTSVVRATSLSNQSVSATANVKIVEGGSKVLSIMPTGLGTYIGDDEYQLSLKSVGSVYAYVSDEKTGNEYNSVDISWSVDDESVISLTPDADINNPTKYVTLKPLQVGTATITATSDGVSKSFKVSVVETVVSSVDMSMGDTITVSLDSYGHLPRLYVYDQFNNSLIDETVSLAVDKPDIIGLTKETIKLQGNYKDEVGIVPQGIGTATITLSVSGTSITKTYMVNVVETEIKRLAFYSDTPSDISLDADYQYVSVSIYDQFGERISYNDIEWASSDTSILDFKYDYQTSKMSYYTYLNPKSKGSVTITATPVKNPALAVARTITVHDSVVTSVSLNSISDLSLASNGYAYAYVRDQFGNTLPNEMIRWSVVGPQIVSLSKTVSMSGSSTVSSGITLTPISAGTTTIRATSVSNDALYWEQDVTVVDSVITGIDGYCSGNKRIFTSEDLESDHAQLTTGTKGYVLAYVRDQFGNTLSNEKIDWSVIEGSDVIEISKTNSDLSSRVEILPLKEGAAKLKVYSVDNPAISKEFTITVEKTQLTAVELSSRIMEIPLLPTSVVKEGSNWVGIEPYVLDQFENIVENEQFVCEIVDGSDVIDIKLNVDDLYPNIFGIVPKKLGSATVKVTSVTNPSISTVKKIYVVEPPEIALRIECNGYMTTNSTSSIRTYAYFESDRQPLPLFMPADLQFTLVSGEDVIELMSSNYGSGYCGVKALSPGVAVIRATALDGTVTAEKTITVVSEAEKTISLEKILYLSKDAVMDFGIYSDVRDQFGNYLNDEITVSATPESVLQVVKKDEVFTLKPQATGKATVTVALAQDPTVKREASVIIDETVVSGLSGTGYIPVDSSIPPSPVFPSTYNGMVGSGVSIPMSAIDQYGNILPNEEVTLEYDATGLSVDSNYVTLLKEGSFTLTVTVKNHPEFTRTFTFTTSGVGPVDPPKPPKSLTVPAPIISPNGDTFSNSREVSISSNSDEIYYTLDGTHPTTSSLKYEGPFSVTETTTVLAIAFNTTSNDKSSVAKAVFLKDVPEQKYNIKVVEQLGGTVIVDKTTANADDLITLTATANDGWKNAGFVITGETSGKITEKTSAVNKFSMRRENITVFVKFEELGNPKASTVKFFREPGDLYVAETVSDRGTLTAEVYDQFGDKFTDSVTWSSDSPDVIEINSATGAYTAKSPGAAVITATSVSDNTVKGTLTLYVYVPPMPQIMGEVNNGALPSVEFGVMSEPFVVDTKNTNYLYWDWDDGSTTKLMVKSPSSVWTNGKYPAWTTSKDSVAHTFIKYGSLQVKVVPKNNYREGDEKIFTVTVTHAAPKNLKITSGPKSVTAGDTATYTAFATNAKSYVWYLDDTEITGQTGASATITFPEDAAGDMSVKVKAYNGVDKYSDLAAKIVSVAQKDGALGLFGETLTTNPEKPIVGEITTFGITGVENAVEYLWTFSDGGERTTTAPAVQYALKATDGNTVTVTAYNSTKQSVSKTFDITGVGEKPTVTLTADRTETEYGTSTTFTASGSGTYSWFIDNVKVDGATSSTYTKSWDYDDIGEHSISVTLTTDYGTATDSVSVLTLTKEGAQSIIKKVIGKTSVKQGTTEKYKVNVMSKDDYTISWYLNGEKKASENINKNDIDSKFFVHTFNDVGRYKLEVEVTTEYEETSFEAIEIDVLPANEFNSNTAKKALEKSNPSEADKIMPTMKEGCTTKNSLGAVSGIVFDKNDLNEDGEPVSVELLLLDDENLKGFTNDMGQKDNILFGIDIKPTGLKNEKALSSYALITIPVEVSKVGNDPSVVKFYRYDTGSDINSWEVLTLAEAPKKEGKFWLFTVQAGGMSQFVGTFDGTVTQPPEVGPSDDKDDGGSSGGSSSGGSGSGGSSGGASAVTPITPTAVETVTPTETVNPTESVSQTEVVTSTELAPTFPSTTTTATPKSPVPVLGLIFGALVGYKLFRRR